MHGHNSVTSEMFRQRGLRGKRESRHLGKYCKVILRAIGGEARGVASGQAGKIIVKRGMLGGGGGPARPMGDFQRNVSQKKGALFKNQSLTGEKT